MWPSILIPFSFHPAQFISISSSLPPLSLPPPYFWPLFCSHSYFDIVRPLFPLHILVSFMHPLWPSYLFFCPSPPLLRVFMNDVIHIYAYISIFHTGKVYFDCFRSVLLLTMSCACLYHVLTRQHMPLLLSFFIAKYHKKRT